MLAVTPIYAILGRCWVTNAAVRETRQLPRYAGERAKSLD